MSGRGGIYEGPDGSKLHGDGREVEAVSQTEQLRAEDIAKRNAKVAEVQTEICRVSRLSPHGNRGIGFFDAIMEVYLFGRDAGYRAAREDAAIVARQFLDDKGMPARCNAVAAAIRKLEPKG